MKAFLPYANEADTLGLGGLNVENRLDRVSIFGSVDLTKDQAGLQCARLLHAVLGDVVAALETEKNLPPELPPPEAPSAARDPFA